MTSLIPSNCSVDNWQQRRPEKSEAVAAFWSAFADINSHVVPGAPRVV